MNKRFYQGSQLTDADLQSISRTLLGIFCVSTSLEIWIGTPAFLRNAADLTNIEAHISRSSTSAGLSTEAALLVVIAKHNSLPTSNLDIQAHEALAELHLAAIDSVLQRSKAVPSEHLEFSALSVKLQLVASLIIDRGRNSTGSSKLLNFPHYLAVANSLAGQLIDIFDKQVQADPTESQFPPATKYLILPKSYFRVVTYAAFLLLRLCSSVTSGQEQDRERSRRMVARARDALMRCSSRVGGPAVGDEPSRASLVIDLLLQHENTEAEGELLEIDDPGGRSIVWDSLKEAYRLRGRRSKTDLLGCLDPTRGARTTHRIERNTDNSPPLANQEQSQKYDAPVELEDYLFDEMFLQLPDLDWFNQQIENE